MYVPLEAQCQICLEGQNLIKPCVCREVHIECLGKWIDSQVQANLRPLGRLRKPFECEICKQPYNCIEINHDFKLDLLSLIIRLCLLSIFLAGVYTGLGVLLYDKINILIEYSVNTRVYIVGIFVTHMLILIVYTINWLLYRNNSAVCIGCDLGCQGCDISLIMLMCVIMLFLTSIILYHDVIKAHFMKANKWNYTIIPRVNV